MTFRFLFCISSLLSRDAGLMSEGLLLYIRDHLQHKARFAIAIVDEKLVLASLSRMSGTARPCGSKLSLKEGSR